MTKWLNIIDAPHCDPALCAVAGALEDENYADGYEDATSILTRHERNSADSVALIGHAADAVLHIGSWCVDVLAGRGNELEAFVALMRTLGYRRLFLAGCFTGAADGRLDVIARAVNARQSEESSVRLFGAARDLSPAHFGPQGLSSYAETALFREAGCPPPTGRAQALQSILSSATVERVMPEGDLLSLVVGPTSTLIAIERRRRRYGAVWPIKRDAGNLPPDLFCDHAHKYPPLLALPEVELLMPAEDGHFYSRYLLFNGSLLCVPRGGQRTWLYVPVTDPGRLVNWMGGIV